MPRMSDQYPISERIVTAGQGKWLSEKSKCLYSAYCHAEAKHSQLQLCEA